MNCHYKIIKVAAMLFATWTLYLCPKGRQYEQSNFPFGLPWGFSVFTLLTFLWVILCGKRLTCCCWSTIHGCFLPQAAGIPGHNNEKCPQVLAHGTWGGGKSAQVEAQVSWQCWSSPFRNSDAMQKSFTIHRLNTQVSYMDLFQEL